MMNATLEEPTTTEEILPPRRRGLRFGRAATTLSVVLTLALGFIAGVEVQKSQGAPAAGAAQGGPAFAARAGGTGGGRMGPLGGFPGAVGGGSSDLVSGTVANKKGRYVYVKDADGNVVRVKTSSTSTITRNAASSTSAIHPGDTVVVQGAKSKDGTVVATRVNATAQGVSPGGGGFGG
jgi:hypothetical protein